MMPSCTNDRAVAAQFAIEKMCLWREIHQQIYKLRVRIASHWFISQQRRCLWARWYDHSYSMPLTGRYYWTVPNCALLNVVMNRRLRIYVSDACEVLKLGACCWVVKMRFQRCAKTKCQVAASEIRRGKKQRIKRHKWRTLRWNTSADDKLGSRLSPWT